PQPLRLPRAAEARQAGVAGEELLHGGLLDGSLLGDQRLQRSEQVIHIRQRLGDGALFANLGRSKTEVGHITPIQMEHCSSGYELHYLIPIYLDRVSEELPVECLHRRTNDKDVASKSDAGNNNATRSSQTIGSYIGCWHQHIICL